MKVEVGTICNNEMTLSRILYQSPIEGLLHVVKNPISATVGLNKLLDKMTDCKVDVAVLVHQDIYLPLGWMNQLIQQISLLPDSWVITGIFGRNEKGNHSLENR